MICRPWKKNERRICLLTVYRLKQIKAVKTPINQQENKAKESKAKTDRQTNMSNNNTEELSDFKSIKVENIVFGEVYRGNYNTFIPIGIVDSQESNEGNEEEIKPFLINTPPSLYSSGIKAIFDREKKYVTGYNICINLYNFKNVSEDEKLFTSN